MAFYLQNELGMPYLKGRRFETIQAAEKAALSSARRSAGRATHRCSAWVFVRSDDVPGNHPTVLEVNEDGVYKRNGAA